MTTGPFEPQAQPIFAIQPVNPLVVHDPAFPSQQDVNPEIAVSHPSLRDVPDAHEQRRLIGSDRPVTYPTPLEPTIIPYDSDKFPEIPRQDYSNLPIQQLGLHDLQHLRLASQHEGMISNYQRLVDGYLAGLEPEKLAKASQVVNSGFAAPILDIGF